MFQQLDRLSRWTIVAIVLLSPVLIYAVTKLPIGSASVHEWLPDRKPEKQRYERFLKLFGSDQFLVASWEDCRVDDPRLELLRDRLLESDTQGVERVASVQTSADVLRLLVEPPLRLTQDQAHERLRGFLVGSDGTAALILRFTKVGIKEQAKTMDHIFHAADQVPGLGRGSLHMAGTLYEAYAIDQAAEGSLKRLVAPSCLIGVLLAWICLRTIRAAVAVLIIAGVGQLLAIAAVYYTGGRFSAVLIVLPTLVFMLTLSGAVHLMNYYGDVSQWDRDHLGSRAMLLGFAPSLLSSVTTSLGMASLAISQLAPIREFGLYSAFSLSVATLFLLLGFPAISDWFCQSFYLRDKVESHVHQELVDEQIEDEVVTHPVHVAPFAARYVAWMERNALWVATLGFALMGFSFYGLMFLKSSTKFDDMFSADSPTVRDMAFIEEHLGPISSVEVLLHFHASQDADLLERVQWVDEVSRQLNKCPEVGGVMSAVTFLPSLPRSSSIRSVAARSVLRSALHKFQPSLMEQGWVAETESSQIWRITAKVPALSKEDYGTLTQRVAAQAKAVVDRSGTPPLFRTEVTGLYPVMHETQLLLLKDLGASFTVAFLLITPVMMLIARGFWAGLLIMIPNVLPETLVFGMMAWLGFQLDIAGLLTASVAMGIAVNDTLHFVNWYARRLALGNTRSLAIGDTMTSCAIAMFHTMLISCCSMFPFLFANFMPTRQFACLMIAMLGSSILGDLVLLPALLLSPLGRCMRPRNLKSKVLEAL